MAKVFLYGLLYMQERCIEVGFLCAYASVHVLHRLQIVFCTGAEVSVTISIFLLGMFLIYNS